MDRNLFIGKLEEIVKKRNLFLCLTFILLGVVVLQSLILFKTIGNQRILLIPMPLQESGWVDKTSVSESYLAEMTRYYSTLFLDRTPEDNMHQMAEILHYSAAQSYGTLKSDLLSQTATLKKNHVSTWFSPLSVSVNVAGLNADITGDLHLIVGKEEVSIKRITYRAHYVYRNGALLISAFNQVSTEK